MFSDIKFWRLVWKEYRTHRALWLTLLIATPVLQVSLLGLLWLLDGTSGQTRWPDLVVGLFAIGYAASFIYVLGSAATSFSVEHETGTFDFQRVLPARPTQVAGAKIGFGLFSSSALILILWIITSALFGPESQGQAVTNWFCNLGFFYLAEVFAWGLMASILIRHPLWSVIFAVSTHSSNYVVLIMLAKSHELDSFSPFMPTTQLLIYRIVAFMILVAADFLLGFLWYEDRLRFPRWRFHWRRNIAPNYPSEGELPPYLGQRQIGWSRLLWLSWRDVRWLIIGFLIWYAKDFYELRNVNAWEELLVPVYLGSFTLGVFAFGSEQWGGRFRFMTERGCLPRHAWLCRQIVCLPPVLVMSVGTAWVQSFHPMASRYSQDHAVFTGMIAAIGPFLCYSAGQLATMLIRSSVVAIAVGIALSMFGFLWASEMSSWLAPMWWSVGSLPVIGLFVTWLRANDWVEERRDRVARWRLVLGFAVPVVLLLSACATYRVIQIPVAQLPADWEEADNAEAILTPADKESLDLYRRAYAEQKKGAQRHFSNYETRRQDIRQAHPDWDAIKQRNEVDQSFQKQWLTEMASVYSLLVEAHARPAVALDSLNSESPRAAEYTSQSEVWTDFWVVLAEHARQQLGRGNLDAVWQDFEMEWELMHRAQLRFTANSVEPIAPYEERLQEAIVEWGRHPNQSQQNILKAIRRLESLERQDVVRRDILRQLITSRSLVDDFDCWRYYVGRTFVPQHGSFQYASWWLNWRMQPWERWRFERSLRRQAAFAVTQLNGLKQQLEANQPLSFDVSPDVGFGPDTSELTLLQAITLPPDMRGGFYLALLNQFVRRAEGFRATIQRLALSDFRREHGHYPRSLSELVPTYFAEVPLSPSSARDVVYLPDGVSRKFTRITPERGARLDVIPNGIPLLAMTDRIVTPRRNPEQEGGWEFTDLNGHVLTTKEGLKTAHVWLVEPPPSNSK